MLLVWTSTDGLDREQFSAVYRGSALENCREMYPEEHTPQAALARYEQEHLAYMDGPFFQEERGLLFILASREGRYRAAVKLYPWQGERRWHIEALETRPEDRGKGYGTQVLREMIARLEQDGPVTLRSEVGNGNASSLHAHLKAGFRQRAEPVTERDGSVNDRQCIMVYQSAGRG